MTNSKLSLPGPLCNKLENLCDNGGICQEDRKGNSTSCACPTGYTGTHCQTTIESHCLNNPCQVIILHRFYISSFNNILVHKH